MDAGLYPLVQPPAPTQSNPFRDASPAAHRGGEEDPGESEAGLRGCESETPNTLERQDPELGTQGRGGPESHPITRLGGVGCMTHATTTLTNTGSVELTSGFVR